MGNPKENLPKTQRLSVHRLAYLAMAVALAALGSMIKLPSPVGSVALDSWPGYLSALLVGLDGAWVALAGHLVSALVAGMPLGLPLHAAVAVEMALCALVFRWVTRGVGVFAGGAVAVVLNGVAAPLVLTPWLGSPLALSLILPLSMAAAANIVVAGVLYRMFGSRLHVESGSTGARGWHREKRD